MSDLVRIVDLEIWTCIGVPDEERAEPQRLLITIEMQVENFAQAAARDDVMRTVDYSQVAEYVKAFAGRTHCKLIETFVEHLSHELLAHFPIKKLRLELKKFILTDAAYVSVEIERNRAGIQL